MTLSKRGANAVDDVVTVFAGSLADDEESDYSGSDRDEAQIAEFVVGRAAGAVYQAPGWEPVSTSELQEIRELVDRRAPEIRAALNQ